MNINVRLFDSDPDLKKWFNAVALSKLDLTFLVEKSLQAYIEKSPVVVGYISTDESQDPELLKNKDILVEVNNISYTAYIRKYSIHGNGANIIKNAIRKSLIQYSGRTYIPTIEEMQKYESDPQPKISLKDNVYVIEASSDKLKLPITTYLKSIEKNLDLETVSTKEFLENLTLAIHNSEIEKNATNIDSCTTAEEVLITNANFEIKEDVIENIIETFIEDDLQELEEIKRINSTTSAPDTLFSKHIILGVEHLI